MKRNTLLFYLTLMVSILSILLVFRDFERIIVPEGKLNDSTKHVDDQEYVCEIRSNQEKNNFEPSNIEDDLFGVHIVDFHSKVYDIINLI